MTNDATYSVSSTNQAGEPFTTNNQIQDDGANGSGGTKGGYAMTLDTGESRTEILVSRTCPCCDEALTITLTGLDLVETPHQTSNDLISEAGEPECPSSHSD